MSTRHPTADENQGFIYRSYEFLEHLAATGWTRGPRALGKGHAGFEDDIGGTVVGGDSARE